MSLEQLAVAYDAAIVSGERERAASFHRLATSRVSAGDARSFSDDVQLLGASVEGGAVPVVTLLWETGAGFVPPPDSTFVVRCRIAEPPPVWVVPVDTLEKEIAPPMTFKPSLWRPEHLYLQRFVWLRRPGKEKCRGHFEPPNPPSADGRPDVPLMLEQVGTATR